MRARSSPAAVLGVFGPAFTLGLSLFATPGCAVNRGPELVQPVGETHTSTSSTGGAQPQGSDSARQTVRVVIGPEVRTACKMPDAEGDALADAPTYAMTSGQLHPHGPDPLKQVATCITSNKLDDTTALRVIGYADPRGASSYAYQLGTYRADAGKQHLIELGVPSNRLRAESRSNVDAKGSDEKSWSLDRRVEIHLIDAGPPALNEDTIR
jgi:outer membrane protein OmpA-like peptidoglycan-associated protein